jgi:hypothetical protein
MAANSWEWLTALTTEKPAIATTSLAIFALITWLIQRILYRLYFHPLAKLPGPAAAAATRLWKGYIECGRNISFCHFLEKLHEEYGRRLNQ